MEEAFEEPVEAVFEEPTEGVFEEDGFEEVLEKLEGTPLPPLPVT